MTLAKLIAELKRHDAAMTKGPFRSRQENFCGYSLRGRPLGSDTDDATYSMLVADHLSKGDADSLSFLRNHAGLLAKLLEALKDSCACGNSHIPSGETCLSALGVHTVGQVCDGCQFLADLDRLVEERTARDADET